jgi:hypothetical protein
MKSYRFVGTSLCRGRFFLGVCARRGQA